MLVSEAILTGLCAAWPPVFQCPLETGLGGAREEPFSRDPSFFSSNEDQRLVWTITDYEY